MFSWIKKIKSFQGLKSIDRLFVFVTLMILVLSFLSMLGLKKKIDEAVQSLVVVQIEKNSRIVMESIGKQLEFGDYRSAWRTLQRQTSSDFLSCHAILDEAGQFLIDDIECKKIFNKLKVEKGISFSQLNENPIIVDKNSAIIKLSQSRMAGSKAMVTLVLHYNISSYTDITNYMDSYFVFFNFLWFFFLIFVFFVLRRSFIRTLDSVNSAFQNLIGGAEVVVGSPRVIEEYFPVSNSVFTLSLKYREAISRIQESARLTAFIDLASQVAHDIRSPLSALSMVIGTLKEIPEDKRILIRNATQRINDIANDLLQKSHKNKMEDTFFDDVRGGNPKGSPKKIELTTEFIPVLIDILISEKRMQYRENSNLEIEVDLKDSFGAFAQINSNELKRVISNLVNNAVEAFENHQGRITVGVKKVTSDNIQKVEIAVKDNGRGIPKHILEKLGQMGVTHGKEGTQSGSGLGVYHAKKTAEAFGGTFEIDSVEGKGTSIRIILPLAEPPIWFAKKISLTGKKYLVSLDDDISIHQIWAGRLSSLGFKNIEHVRFQSGEAFRQYVNSNMNKLKESLFLVDYELLNQPLTGLDVIDELGIEKYSILVTSRYEEGAIQDRTSRLKLLLLPKALAGFVPFEMDAPKEVYDWVLLDDDELVHMTWDFAAKEYGKTFLGFKTPEQFKAHKNKFKLEQKIFIDSNLAHGIKGEDIARQLFAEGFNNLYLATGYSPDQFPEMGFIKGVVGKEPPKF
jgi:signal transduction histidine kinase